MIRPTDGSAKMITPQEVARRLGVSDDHVISWIRGGELVALDISSTGARKRRYRIAESDLAAFIERRLNSNTPPVVPPSGQIGSPPATEPEHRTARRGPRSGRTAKGSKKHATARPTRALRR